MTATVIDGKQIAEQTRAEAAAGALALKTRTGVIPHLAAVLVGEDPASAVYVRNKQIACEKAGFKSTLHRLPASTGQAELLALVQALNADSGRARHPGAVAAAEGHRHHADPRCDPAREGRRWLSPGKRRPDAAGAAALPAVHASRRACGCSKVSGIETAGTHAVVIGRSDIVGKPMAVLLAQKGADATVTVCHSRTQDLRAFCREADILVAALGIPQFVKGDWIKPGAVVIDVGINRVGDKLVGDVDYLPAAQVASAITPVPGGVGPMTIAMLLANTLQAAINLSGSDGR